MGIEYLALPKRAENLTGRSYGRLVVLGLVDKIVYPNHQNPKYPSVHMIWECRCACGKSTRVSAANLRSGNTQSCGCHKQHALYTRGTPKALPQAARTADYLRWKIAHAYGIDNDNDSD